MEMENQAGSTRVRKRRHAYQEPLWITLISVFCGYQISRVLMSVTKYSAYVGTLEQLPFYLRQAFRSATTGTPGPAHLDLEGIAGSAVIDREGEFEIIIEDTFAQLPPFRPEAEAEKVAETLSNCSLMRNALLLWRVAA